MKVLLVCDTIEPIGDQPDYKALFPNPEWKVERDCYEAIKALGYECEIQNICDKLEPLIEKIKEFQPDIIFNMVESFKGISHYERNVVGLFELMGVPYTGAGPVSIMLCKNKAITKEVLSHHRVSTPRFKVYQKNKKILPPKAFTYPILIKPLKEEASYGISKDSFVEDDKSLVERVQYIHEKLNQEAIAEQYIEGRELYVSVIGNKNLQVFPIRELKFPSKDDAPQFATYKIKWDNEYRKKWNVRYDFARLTDEKLEREIIQTAKRAYRALHIQGYGRFDMRLTPEGKISIFEVNPNPNLAKNDEFFLSARKAGLEYEEMVKRIISLGLEYSRATVV